MSLPPWIAEKLDGDESLNNKLTQQHVVETMYDADRPFFSLQQIQQRIKPDVSKVTVRNRLDELEELGVVATDRYSDSLTLYYINHPESDWPLSPEGKRAIDGKEGQDSSPLFEFLRHPQVSLILREELLRSIGWAALGLFGWAMVINSSEQLPANVWTVFGLPILTWASLTVGMIGYRLATGATLQVQTKEGLHAATLGGAVLGGFWAVFLIFVLDRSPLLIVGLYVFTTAVYLLYYTRVILPQFDSPVEG